MYKIEIPTGHRIAEANKETGEVTFEKIQPKYPSSIFELSAKGYYINNNGDVVDYTKMGERSIFSAHHLPTESLAKAFKALMILKAINYEYNRIDCFVADWSDSNQAKFTIDSIRNSITTDYHYSVSRPLYFGSPETRDLFLTNFRDLIEQAKELL